MRHRLLTLPLLIGIPLLGLGLAAPASADTGFTAHVTSGTLVARGAAVDLTATATCQPGYEGGLDLTVTERSGNGIAQGVGRAGVPCTGQPQTVTVRVVALDDVAPFRVGDAVVTGLLQTSGIDDFKGALVSDTIRIAR